MMKQLVLTLLFAFSIGMSEANAGIIVDPIFNTGNYTLIQNGDFETGDMSGWTDQFGSPLGGFDASTNESFHGQYSARANTQQSFTGPGYSFFSERVPVISNETYVLSAFFHVDNVDPNAALYAHYFSVSSLPIGYRGVRPEVSGWFFSWEEYTVPTGVNTLRVRIVRDVIAAAGAFSYIDDVALTPLADFVAPTSAASISPVPEPSSILLLGFGFGAFFVFNRIRPKFKTRKLNEYS